MRHLVLAFGLATSACGNSFDPQQSPPCKAYIDCFEKTGGTKGSLDATFGAMGTCWTTTVERANACEGECAVAVDARIRAFPDAGCHTR